MKDSLGDRMKSQYEDRTRFFLPRRTYTIIRVDGKAFHTFTRGCAKPYDLDLMATMDKVAVALCEQIQGACFAYTQSDEISILLTDFAKPGTSAWFDGNVQKMASIAAAIATAAFNKEFLALKLRGQGFGGVHQVLEEFKPATFDARVFTIPDPVEVANYFIWRQQDATRNSVQMAARAVYSHKECENKDSSELQEMLHQKGINWNDYTSGCKRGRAAVKTFYELKGFCKDPHQKAVDTVVTRSCWTALTGNGESNETPIFTQDKDFLKNLIPQIAQTDSLHVQDSSS